MTIVDGAEVLEDEIRENEDAFESRLIVRLHCKHGIVKTHRLLLNTPSVDGIPNMEQEGVENHIAIQANTIKEVIEHFPNTRGPKNDPELIWWFGRDDVRIRSMEKGIDVKGSEVFWLYIS